MSVLSIIPLSILALAGAVQDDDSRLRLPVGAQVPESCAVIAVDSTRWAAGRLRIHAQCNVQRYSLRLSAGEQVLVPDQASLFAGEGEIEVRNRRVWVTQDEPGSHLIDLMLDADETDITRLSVRIDAG